MCSTYLDLYECMIQQYASEPHDAREATQCVAIP
jgi:hypothetical protein